MVLKNELKLIEEYLEKFHQSKTEVSSKGVDWHLDHSLKVINGVCVALEKSDPNLYQWKFNTTRMFVFLVKHFPRGKAKAPKRVLPPEIILKEDISKQIVIAKEKLKNIVNLPSKSNFIHPYFGMLNLKQTQKFLQLHTIHHLKICKDIIN